MMDEDAWITTTLELLHRAETDRDRAQVRLETAHTNIQALRQTLDYYCRVNNLPRVPCEAVDGITEEYRHLAPKEMLRHWAWSHDGIVEMRVVCRTLADAGLFVSPLQASGTLYRTARRMVDFEQIGKGMFRLKAS